MALSGDDGTCHVPRLLLSRPVPGCAGMLPAFRSDHVEFGGQRGQVIGDDVALGCRGGAAQGSPDVVLFAAFGLEMIYSKQDHQVTIYATITPSTPAALAEIIASSEPPTTPAEPTGVGHSLKHPRRSWLGQR